MGTTLYTDLHTKCLWSCKGTTNAAACNGPSQTLCHNSIELCWKLLLKSWKGFPWKGKTNERAQKEMKLEHVGKPQCSYEETMRDWGENIKKIKPYPPINNTWCAYLFCSLLYTLPRNKAPCPFCQAFPIGFPFVPFATLPVHKLQQK